MPNPILIRRNPIYSDASLPAIVNASKTVAPYNVNLTGVVPKGTIRVKLVGYISTASGVSSQILIQDLQGSTYGVAIVGTGQTATGYCTFSCNVALSQAVATALQFQYTISIGTATVVMYMPWFFVPTDERYATN